MIAISMIYLELLFVVNAHISLCLEISSLVPFNDLRSEPFGVAAHY